MTGDEIFGKLQINKRWGGNQPSIYLTTAVLEALPINHLAVMAEGIQILMSRDLSTAEFFLLATLKPDSFAKDGYDINLWWD